ncbi:Uncharacterised protein [Staphylococcus aureus]|nr:DUF4811 domain-containing protein [Staphylococcus aureus]SBA83733.1 Uncharacterised protein [Staphylococcus aureus]SBB62769.1 Uncharacterised protein [Staphylococcus aureus]
MITTIVLTLCTFVSWLLIPHKITRYILGTLFTLALTLTIIGITANMTNHWGMEKKVITSNKKEIFTGGPKNNPANILIINEIGKIQITMSWSIEIILRIKNLQLISSLKWIKIIYLSPLSIKLNMK